MKTQMFSLKPLDLVWEGGTFVLIFESGNLPFAIVQKDDSDEQSFRLRVISRTEKLFFLYLIALD